MDAQIIGSFIAQRRKELNMTQTELAQMLYVTDKAISRWERGVGLPDINTIEPLAQALQVSLVDLMQGKQTSEKMLDLQEAEKIIADTIQLSRKGTPATFLGIGVLGLLGIACLFIIGLLLTDTAVLGYPVGSLVTGLIAWAIPLWQMTFSQRGKAVAAVFLSLMAATTSIIVQLFSLAHKVDIRDFAAIEDTIHGLCGVVVLFSVITVLLNLLMLWRVKRNKND